MGATIVDSNVIIDVLDPDSEWTGWAKREISAARLGGELVFNVVIAAEVAHEFTSRERYRSVFTSALWTLEDIPFEAALLAGWAHREYRSRGGRREKTLPDFLIGAHAAVRGHRVLTRDPSGYRSYFPAVELLAPDTHP
jgi:predicted nucleic acid-binding protein